MKELILKETNDPAVLKKFGQNGDKSFEITNKMIHFRQEVIAQSIGGLDVFQITITKTRVAGSIKHKNK